MTDRHIGAQRRTAAGESIMRGMDQAILVEEVKALQAEIRKLQKELDQLREQMLANTTDHR